LRREGIKAVYQLPGVCADTVVPNRLKLCGEIQNMF